MLAKTLDSCIGWFCSPKVPQDYSLLFLLQQSSDIISLLKFSFLLLNPSLQSVYEWASLGFCDRPPASERCTAFFFTLGKHWCYCNSLGWIRKWVQPFIFHAFMCPLGTESTDDFGVMPFINFDWFINSGSFSKQRTLCHRSHPFYIQAQLL